MSHQHNDPRPTRDEATNKIMVELVRVLKEEYGEAQRRAEARIEHLVRDLPNVLGAGWTMTGDPEAVIQEFVEAAAQVSECVVDNWGMDNFIGQGGLTLELDLAAKERYAVEIMERARQALADAPGTVVEPNKFWGCSRIDIVIPHIKGRRNELENRLKEMLRTWSQDRNTAPPSFQGTRMEDEDDNLGISLMF